MAFIAMSTFCDDIRQEVSGKVSLIGTYGSHMYVDGFPVRLPKLCVNFSAVMTKDEERIDSLKFFIFCGDTKLHGMSIEGFPQPVDIGTESRIVGGVDIPFFEMETSDVLEAFFEKNGQRIDAGRLIVEKNPDEN